MTTPPIERSSGNPIHPFRQGETTGLCNIHEWCLVHGVSDVVRLTPVEFQFAKSVQSLTHFNLQLSGFIPQHFYAGLEIYRNGHFDGGSETNPVLNLNQWLKLLCLESRNNVLYSDLKPGDFMNNDLEVSTPEALIGAVWKKYHPVLPNLSYPEFVQAGLCITRFQIIEHHPIATP
jgi:hypothetical protein